MYGQQIRVGEIISEAWKFTKENLGFLLSFMVIYLLIHVLISAANDKSGSMIVQIFGAVISAFISMGLYHSSLLISGGVKPGLDQLYSNWPKFGTWFLASILFGLMLFFGLILFIVPAFYVLARYGLYPFFILDRSKNLGAIEALKAASDASEGRRWQLFLLIMSCFGLNMLGALFFGVGLLITAPIALISMAIAYRKLTAGDVTLITEP